MRFTTVFFAGFLSLPLLAQRPTVVLDSGVARLMVDLLGGGIVGFEFKDAPLNPFTWEQKGGEQEARPRGHFLCLDRWGAPSDAEKANGMPFHGEASKVLWKVARQSALEVEMTAELPMAKLKILRRVRMEQGAAVADVSETVTNLNPLGRIYNWVQHPSIAPPFLDESTVVSSNAGMGFPQSDPESTGMRWPWAPKNDMRVNVSRLGSDPDPNVVSFVIDGETGWVTAANPSKKLLVGYSWSTKDYPWLNIWRHSENGKPAARGLEFGTTGLHQPFPVLVKKGTMLGRPLYAFLDAGESQSRSYWMFLAHVVESFSGASSVTRVGNKVSVQ